MRCLQGKTTRNKLRTVPECNGFGHRNCIYKEHECEEHPATQFFSFWHYDGLIFMQYKGIIHSKKLQNINTIETKSTRISQKQVYSPILVND